MKYLDETGLAYLWTKIKSKFSSLHTVATSGNYNDLINKPTIPNKLADLNDIYLVEIEITQASSTSVSDYDVVSINRTPQEIKAAYDAGKKPVARFIHSTDDWSFYLWGFYLEFTSDTYYNLYFNGASDDQSSIELQIEVDGTNIGYYITETDLTGAKTIYVWGQADYFTVEFTTSEPSSFNSNTIYLVKES